jgi:hypothetical protein
VESYRAYYIFVKRYFAKWTKRAPPKWFTAGVEGMSDQEREASEKKILSVKEGKKRKSENIKKNKEKKLAKQIAAGEVREEDVKGKKSKKAKLDSAPAAPAKIVTSSYFKNTSTNTSKTKS